MAAKFKVTETAETEPKSVVDKLVEQGITDPAHQAIITDEFAGQGGSYNFDPDTGKRTRNE